MATLTFNLTPVQSSYVESTAVVNVIYSSMGEGKSFASVVAMLRHAERCGRPIRCAIVRDTHENIKNSTVRTIQDIFEGHPDLIRFKNDYKQLTIFTNPKIEVDLFGIDDPASLSKLQGPEYALIWLEEPAPMSDKANAGLSEDVFNAALARCVRQKNTIPRLQVSMNPADHDHWTYKRFFEEEHMDPEHPEITKAVFRVAPGSNPHLNSLARAAVAAAYRHDEAAYTRYVKGEFAPVYHGERVTPEYNPDWHLSKAPLAPVHGLVGFRFWDGWHNPACILGQITKIGRLVVLDVVKLKNADIGILIDTKVLPLLESPRWKGKVTHWRDIGDRSMANPDQSNRRNSAAKVIERKLNTFFEGGPARWESLKRAIKSALNMNIEGKPALLINREASVLHKALSGGWHYKTDNSGNIIGHLPVKNESSHIGDALANGLAVLLPEADTVDYLGIYRELSAKRSRRVASYAVGGGVR